MGAVAPWRTILCAVLAVFVSGFPGLPEHFQAKIKVWIADEPPLLALVHASPTMGRMDLYHYTQDMPLHLAHLYSTSRHVLFYTEVHEWGERKHLILHKQAKSPRACFATIADFNWPLFLQRAQAMDLGTVSNHSNHTALCQHWRLKTQDQAIDLCTNGPTPVLVSIPNVFKAEVLAFDTSEQPEILFDTRRISKAECKET